MKEEFLIMRDNNLLQPGAIIYDHSDGCCSQYRSATAIEFMAILCCLFGVTIDRMIHAPSHGKGIVDGLAAVIKRFLLMCMRNADKCLSEKKEMSYHFYPWMHSEDEENSFAEQAVMLCNSKFSKEEINDDDKISDSGNKRRKTDDSAVQDIKVEISPIGYGNKRKKRDMNKSITKYHFRKTSSCHVEYQNIKMNTIKLPTSNQQHGGSSAMYNIRTDPQLGYGKAALRRIPCACQSCINQLSLPWDALKPYTDQPRYAQNKNCVHWSIFEGENDWQIVTINFTNSMNDDDYEHFAETVFEEYSQVIRETITPGTFGAVAVTSNDEFEIVRFINEPYVFHWSTFMGDKQLVKEAKEGDLIVDVESWLKVPNQSNWYYHNGDNSVEIVRKIVATELDLKPNSTDNPMPRISSYRKNRELLQHAHMIERDAIYDIIEKIKVRELGLCY